MAWAMVFERFFGLLSLFVFFKLYYKVCFVKKKGLFSLLLSFFYSLLRLFFIIIIIVVFSASFSLFYWD